MKKRLSKGISPLIAAVMLLAFAMAIGGLFSEWSGELVESSTTDTSDTQTEVLDCSARAIEIDRIEDSNNWVNVTLRADGGDLGEIQVIVYPSKETGTTELNRDGAINTTSLDVSGSQDRVRAASKDCEATVENEIE